MSMLRRLLVLVPLVLWSCTDGPDAVLMPTEPAPIEVDGPRAVPSTEPGPTVGSRFGSGPVATASSAEGPTFDAATADADGPTAFAPPQSGVAGQTSLLWQNTITGQRFLWLMQNTSVTQGASLSSVPTRWNMDAAADMNGDDLVDIVWTNRSTGLRYVWYMSGTTDIGGGSLGTVGTGWIISGLGDFTGNNKTDIVWTNTATGERYVWYMDGMTNTGGASLGSVPIHWVIDGVADMNGDGKVDLVWTNTATGQRYVWTMDGTTNTGGASLGTVGVHWEIVGARDMTGDGKPDLIWQNTLSGQRYVWYMDGLTNTGGVVLTENSTEWDIGAVSIDPPNATPAVVITTSSLPSGVTGTAYNQTLAASGGTGTFTWSITSGSLPNGLSLNATTGAITGTPSSAGASSFTVQVTSGTRTATQALSITIYSPVTVTTSSLPAGVQGTAYAQVLAATGGTGTYTWSVTAGALPGGLTLEPSLGEIMGTPTAAGTFNFTVQASSGALSGTRALSIVITAPCTLASTPDTDGDRLPDCVETNTNTYVSTTNTGTNPAVADTDADGINDGDEVLGTLAGLDLPAMGTNPLKKNILLEYDWFDDAIATGAHSHRPNANVVGKVTTMFANSPVTNPDGTTGVTVLHDYGQGGAFTGGTLIADADGVLTGDIASQEYADLLAANFATNRNGYFHWVLMPHTYGGTNSSGQAFIYDHRMIVSTVTFYANDQAVANTIAHELGHNLGLGHGAPWSQTVQRDLNFKPNYNSVMNYRYQFPGVDNNCNITGDNVLDFSRGTRITLNEASLNEPDGICGTPAINWNGDADATDLGVSIDAQAFSGGTGNGSSTDVLSDHDDWAAILINTAITGDDGGAGLIFDQTVGCQIVPGLP